jgi:hypothetical protein
VTIKITPDPTLRNNLMAFGREHDDGWNRLVDELIEKLDKLPEEIKVLQIKEKFAGLRFYVYGASEKAHEIISLYEKYSYHICEYCGEFYTAKERLSHGWWKTLCDKHAKKWAKGTLYESKWARAWSLFLYKLKRRI